MTENQPKKYETATNANWYDENGEERLIPGAHEDIGSEIYRFYEPMTLDEIDDWWARVREAGMGSSFDAGKDTTLWFDGPVKAVVPL